MPIHIPVNDLAPHYKAPIIRVFECVSMSLNCLDKLNESSCVLPDSILQLRRKTPRTFGTIKDDAKLWTVTCGFRDALEAIEPFLETTRHFCSGLKAFGGSKEPTEEQWCTWLDAESRDKNTLFRKGPYARIKKLTKKYGSDLFPDWVYVVESINLARNCLVHRQGVVSDDDQNESDALCVSWLGYADTLPLKRTVKDKRFPIGSTITFSTEEFSEICSTLLGLIEYVTQQIGKRYKLNRKTDASGNGATIGPQPAGPRA